MADEEGGFGSRMKAAGSAAFDKIGSYDVVQKSMAAIDGDGATLVRPRLLGRQFEIGTVRPAHCHFP